MQHNGDARAANPGQHAQAHGCRCDRGTRVSKSDETIGFAFPDCADAQQDGRFWFAPNAFDGLLVPFNDLFGVYEFGSVRHAGGFEVGFHACRGTDQKEFIRRKLFGSKSLCDAF
jgi:hypothetical protein